MAKDIEYNTITVFGKDNLSIGSEGVHVYNLQLVLYRLGFLSNKNECDGLFGKTTKDALMAFQSANYLRVDGVAGSKTKAEMMKKRLMDVQHHMEDNDFSEMVYYH